MMSYKNRVIRIKICEDDINYTTFACMYVWWYVCKTSCVFIFLYFIIPIKSFVPWHFINTVRSYTRFYILRNCELKNYMDIHIHV